jgi:hypothetical protein
LDGIASISDVFEQLTKKTALAKSEVCASLVQYGILFPLQTSFFIWTRCLAFINLCFIYELGQ